MNATATAADRARLDALKQAKKDFLNTPFYETEIKHGPATIALQRPKQKALKRVFGEILDKSPIAIKDPDGKRDNFSYGMNLITGEIFVVIAEHSKATMQSIQDFDGYITHPMQPDLHLPVLHVAPDDFAMAYEHDQMQSARHPHQMNMHRITSLQTTAAVHYLGAKNKDDFYKLMDGCDVMTSTSYHSLVKPFIQEKFGAHNSHIGARQKNRVHYKHGNVEPAMMWTPGIDIIGDIIDSGGSLYGDKWPNEELSAYKRHFGIKADVGVGIPYVIPIGVSTPGLWANKNTLAALTPDQQNSFNSLTKILKRSSESAFPHCTLSAEDLASKLITPGTYTDPQTLARAIWSREDILLATGREATLKKNGFNAHALPEDKEMVLPAPDEDLTKKEIKQDAALQCLYDHDNLSDKAINFNNLAHGIGVNGQMNAAHRPLTTRELPQPQNKHSATTVRDQSL